MTRQTGNREWLSLLISNLGLTTRKQGDYVQAEDYLQEGLQIAWEIGIPLDNCKCFIRSWQSLS